MSDHLTIRTATRDDIPTIVYHRHAMFKDMGHGTEASRAKMDEGTTRWLERMMVNGAYLGWFACDGDVVVAGIGLWLMDWIPAVDGFAGRLPYLLNVYTEQDYRRRGLAQKLVKIAMSWCKAEGYPRLRLHASEYGRPLYHNLGFTQNNEMQIKL